MKILAVIPYWSGYLFPEGNLESRDELKLGGRALIDYSVDLLSKAEEIDKIFIYSSDNKIMDLISDKNVCTHIQRHVNLDNQNVSIEKIIKSFLMKNDANIIILMHPKNPFLSLNTLNLCIDAVKSGKYDSACAVSKPQKLAWFQGSPLNYSIGKDTPALSKVDKITLELSSLYVFTRQLFEEKYTRIGEDPFFVEVGHFEGFEIEREDDLEIGELIINAGLSKSKS